MSPRFLHTFLHRACTGTCWEDCGLKWSVRERNECVSVCECVCVPGQARDGELSQE